MTRKFGGTGLGLVLSKQIAQLLGGDVRLERSVPGLGSVFCAEAVVKPASPDVEMVHSLASPTITVNMDPQKPIDLSQFKILLVDDSPDNQVLIGRFLKGAGANVETANNGLEAVASALSGDHDVVLMDIQMPHLDGYEATRRLRARGYNKPIIALTAHALKEEREKSLDAGCNGHLTKPIEKRALLDFLSQVGPFDSQSVSADASAGALVMG